MAPQAQPSSSSDMVEMKKMGVMRFVYVVIDYSSMMLNDQFLFPNLITITARRLRDFIQKFFQYNPIAQIGLILCVDRRAKRVASFTSDIKTLTDTLDKLNYAECQGEFSLQSSLKMAIQDLQGQPGYASREIIVLSGSLASIDAGNIFSTIEVLKRSSIRCSVVGLCAELFVFRKLCQSTKGTYDIITDEGHLINVFEEFIKPVVMDKNSESNLIRVCFPIREDVFAPPACICHQEDFSEINQFFVCGNCGAHFCSTPIECTVCGMLLITAPQLARAFQHLIELEKYNVVSDYNGKCYACQFDITDTAYQCGKCEAYFCDECNKLTHNTLQVCPSCV